MKRVINEIAGGLGAAFFVLAMTLLLAALGWSQSA